MAAGLSRGDGSEAGFSLVELLTVGLVIVLILAAAFPKVHSAYSAETVREAQYLTESYLTTARAASVQKGRTTIFHSAGQRVWVTTDSSGVQVSYRAVVRLDSAYNVTMTASRDSIVFNGRGIAVGLSGSQTITVSKTGVTRSICISALGAILREGCAS
jgi:Tfp pilus assembly protein FimT